MDVDILMDNESLVYSIINKYQNYYDKDDLYQVGMIGVINAYKNFDKKQGIKFSTYAYKYILGEVNKYIRENNNLKVGKDIISLKRKIEKARDLLSQKLCRGPTLTELSLFLDIDYDKLVQVESISQKTKSLDYVFDVDANSLYDVIKAYDNNTKAEYMDLKYQLEKLTDEEKKIITDRYYRDLTQREISEDMGMSQVQVYRKEDKILKKLKQVL